MTTNNVVSADEWLNEHKALLQKEKEFSRRRDALFQARQSLKGAYQYLDISPLGRNESGLSYPMEWVRLHDEY